MWAGGAYRPFRHDLHFNDSSFQIGVSFGRRTAVEPGVLLMHLIHTIPLKCTLCEDCGWVCENHPHKPWEGEHACNCGGAGAPCAWCNQNDAEHPPRMPGGFDQKGQ